MEEFRIACQTITWGKDQKNRFPEVFADVAAAGFAGVEIGFRHIRETPSDELMGLLRDRRLCLAASHVGGNLFDAEQASEERGTLQEVISYLGKTGTGMLMYSGLRYRDDAQLAADIDTLNRAAELCAGSGIRLLYHNHAFEFEHDRRVIRALLDDGADALGFCPDVGWVMKGGMDIVEFLDAAKDRIGAIHFKDFATREHRTDTVVLGEGVAPLAETAQWLKRNRPGLWVIAEQDNADVSPSEAAASNAAYIKGLLC